MFGYTGREHDEATGLNNYRARWYDPLALEFLSEDPLGFAGGDSNLSRYVGNRPVDYTDPSGMSWLSSFWNKVTSVVDDVFDDVGDFFEDTFEDVGDFFEDAFDDHRRFHSRESLRSGGDRSSRIECWSLVCRTRLNEQRLVVRWLRCPSKQWLRLHRRSWAHQPQ